MVRKGDDADADDGVKGNCFTNLLADHPIPVFLLTLALAGVLTVVIVLTDGFELTDVSARDYFIEDEIPVDRYDAVDLIDLGVALNASLDLQSQQQNDWDVNILWVEKDDGPILTPENIAAMKEVELLLESLQNWEYICYKGLDNEDLNCSASGNAVESITLYFPDDVASWTQTDVDTQLDTIADSIMDLVEDGVDAKESAYAKTIYSVGYPISSEANGETYVSSTDRPDDQEEQVEVWADLLSEYLIDEIDNMYGNMKIYFDGRQITTRQLFRYADADVLYAGGSVAVVMGIIWLHTRSLFLAAVGMLEVILSFPIAFFIYRVAAGIEMFQTIHMLTIFLILGIGADDFFVYMDAWRQAPVIYPPAAYDMRARVAYTYKRATKAMFVTTFTTCAAFGVTAFSKVLPIASFGLFAALLIAANFLLVITLFASAVVIYQKYLINVCTNRCKRKKKPQKQQQPNQGVQLHEVGDLDKYSVGSPSRSSLETGPDESEVEFGPVERFFSNVYVPFLDKVKIPVLLIFFGWLGYSSYLSANLAPLSEQEQWFPSDHAVRIGDTLNDEIYPTSSTSGLLGIQVYWGLDGVDRNGSSSWDPTSYGYVVYDEDFDLSTVAAQEFIIETCDDLNASTTLFVEDGQNSISCFMWEFRDWAETNGYGYPVNESFNEVFEEWYTTDVYGIVYEANNFFYVVDGNVEVMFVLYYLDANRFTPEAEATELYNDWESYWSTKMDGAPDEMDGGFQISYTWAWIITEKALVTGAWSGMMYASVMAFIILLLSTANIFIALAATICIMGVLTSVIAIMYFRGAELGTAESISMVMLIGFSVDYVVHLGNHYIDSSHNDRKTRMNHALRDMGISVLSGGITTLGSASFLWFATMLFFTKFAYIMTSTVIFSWLWSMVFFSALMLLCGPQEDTGNLKQIFNICRKKGE